MNKKLMWGIIVILAVMIVGIIWSVGMQQTAKAPSETPNGNTPGHPVAGPGKHCGGNVANAPVCSTGYECQAAPGSHLPVGDVGGICVAAGASTGL